MTSAKLIGEEIRLKVIRLLEVKKELKIRLAESQNEVSRLKKELDSQKNTVTILEEKNKIVKIAESLSVSGDVQVLKKKLDLHIREIDECIRLLSDK